MALRWSSHGVPRVLVYCCIVAFLWLLYTFSAAQTDKSADRTDRWTAGNLPSEPSKLLVVATHPGKVEATKWVNELSKIYVAGDHEAKYHTKLNKGNEGNHFLTYIIDNYSDLPDVVVFAHFHNTGPHDDAALGSNIAAIGELNLDHVLLNDYQSLRCEPDFNNTRCTENIDWWNKANTDEWRSAWSFVLPNEPCPQYVQAPCCAQFATTGKAIRRRPREVYVKLHQWLLTNPWGDYHAGRVVEYIWHILFGKPAMYCLNRSKCLCEGWGLCSMNEQPRIFPT